MRNYLFLLCFLLLNFVSNNNVPPKKCKKIKANGMLLMLLQVTDTLYRGTDNHIGFFFNTDTSILPKGKMNILNPISADSFNALKNNRHNFQIARHPIGYYIRYKSIIDKTLSSNENKVFRTNFDSTFVEDFFYCSLNPPVGYYYIATNVYCESILMKYKNSDAIIIDQSTSNDTRGILIGVTNGEYFAQIIFPSSKEKYLLWPYYIKL